MWGRSATVALLALAAVLLPAPTALAGIAPKHVRGHIVNGQPAGASIPYQVALVEAGRGAPFPVFCGGTIRDATHVITAAHCVADSDAGEIAVVAGLLDRGTGAGAEIQAVSAISSHPAYTEATGADVAILTLAAPLAAGSAIAVTPAGADWTNAMATISGWGLLSEGGDSPLLLQRAKVRVLPDAACGSYGPEFVPATMLCAGGTTGAGGTIDTCQGDSGGPLAADAPGTPLVGVVSFGRDCADPLFPGVYARLADPGLNAFATTDAPAPRPELVARPVVQGATTVGRTLTCEPGAWTGDPVLSFTWLSAVARGDGRVADVRVDGRGAQLSLGAGHAGRVVTCEVAAGNAGGVRTVQAQPVGPVDGGPVAAAPPGRALPADLVAPVVRVTRRRCAKRRCTLTFRASDSGGPATRATVSYARLTGCRKGRAGRRCRATRTMRAKAAGRGLFTATTPRLAVARYRFRVVATDAAGNRSRASTVALRVPRR